VGHKLGEGNDFSTSPVTADTGNAKHIIIHVTMINTIIRYFFMVFPFLKSLNLSPSVPFSLVKERGTIGGKVEPRTIF
jgi:hypothetical protein